MSTTRRAIVLHSGVVLTQQTDKQSAKNQKVLSIYMGCLMQRFSVKFTPTHSLSTFYCVTCTNSQWEGNPDYTMLIITLLKNIKQYNDWLLDSEDKMENISSMQLYLNPFLKIDNLHALSMHLSSLCYFLFDCSTRKILKGLM